LGEDREASSPPREGPARRILKLKPYPASCRDLASGAIVPPDRTVEERAMNRRGLTDREWTRLRPLLPPRPRTGRPPKDHRVVLDALLWLGRTGAPWRDLPGRFGPWRTVATRFYRWTRSGLWERILDELRRLADAAGVIDWEVHMVDGTSVRAHRCAAGGKGGRIARRWAAAAAGSAASCTCAAIAAAGQWRSR
jgi:transposase